MPVGKMELDNSPNHVEENWAFAMSVTELEMDGVDHYEAPKAEKSREGTKKAKEKIKGSMNLLDPEEENEVQHTAKQQQDWKEERELDEREKIHKLKQNEAVNQKEEGEFENVTLFQSNKYGLEELKVGEDESHHIKDVNENKLRGQSPFEVVQEYKGREILLFPISDICDCDQRELGIQTHCMSAAPKYNMSDEWDIALQEGNIHEISHALTQEPMTDIAEVHASLCEGKVHEYQIMPVDEAQLFLTVLAKSENILNDPGKKQVREMEKDPVIRFENQIDDGLKTFTLPTKEYSEELTELPVLSEGPNVDGGNIHVQLFQTETQVGPSGAFEYKRQQVWAKRVAREVNEEKETARDIDVNDDGTWTMLDSNARDESQGEMDRFVIDELSHSNGDKGDNVQSVDLNILQVQGTVNREQMGEFGEVTQNVPYGCMLSSIKDPIVHDMGTFKSLDVVKANREVKALQDAQTAKKQKNIVEANVSIGSMPIGIDEKTIIDIDWKQDKVSDSEVEAYDVLNVLLAEVKQPLNGNSKVGFQKKDIIENSDDTYKSKFNRESPSDVNFPTWSSSPITRVMDVSSKWSNLEDDGYEDEEEEYLRSKETYLVASNISLVPCAADSSGLGSSVPALKHASCMVRHSLPDGSSVSQQSLSPRNQNDELNETNEIEEELQGLRVKFLRLAHRFDQTPLNYVVGQVLYRLGFAEQLWRSRTPSRTGAFKFDRSNLIAQQLEASGQEDLDFTCTIMVLGKTGVGKSATINSIFDEVKSKTDAFGLGTKKVQEIVGTVNGISVRVIDTPGLLVSFADQPQNVKILSSVKRFIKKRPPDIVLYIDRLDIPSRGNGDLPLLHTVTDAFRPVVWFNVILVFTHAASSPPEDTYGTSISYQRYVSQRSQVMQQAIRQAAGDMWLMNPVCLAENHPSCRTNRAGERVLPNGQIWKTELLLLCFASKILAEANSLLKLQDDIHEKPLVSPVRASLLPFFLSSLLQSRSQLKLPKQHLGDLDGSDDDFEDLSDLEEESEYDKLPSFRHLTKSQLAKLDKEQTKAYFDELDYREKLFMKKQWKEERLQRCTRKKMSTTSKEKMEVGNKHMEEEDGIGALIPISVPDRELPPSFDANYPAYRYRFLETVSQWVVDPILESHGWDHDIGFEGFNLEKTFVIGSKIPVAVLGQVIKDKDETNLQLECAASLKHGEGKMTLARLDIQAIGREASYTLQTETRFSNFRYNKAIVGMAFTLLRDSLSAGMKLEDILMIGKRFKVVLNGGATVDKGDLTYGGSLEATLRGKDYPIGGTLATLGLSITKHGDLTTGVNFQSKFGIGRSTTMAASLNLNSRGKGQASIRISSLEHLQIALVGVIPIVKALIGDRL